MLFSIIYSFECPADVSVKTLMPPKRSRWKLTECGPSEVCDGWKHRKLCAILTRKQFTAFVEHCGLHAQDCETMGSVGAPGFGFGWAPAISFDRESDFGYANAYVTPVPRKAPFSERNWGRIERATVAVYG